MKNILIISSTKNSNLELSKDIKDFLDKEKKFKSEIINLEDFELPLFTPTIEKNFIENSELPPNVNKIKDKLINSYAMIWCSPEYNGGIAPIVTNTISWISRVTDNWKEAFQDKTMLVCTSSGGNGKNFISGFNTQLEYLGAKPFEDSIISTKKRKIDQNEFNRILHFFCDRLNN